MLNKFANDSSDMTSNDSMFIRRSQFLKVDNRCENLICEINPKAFLSNRFFKICSRFLRKGKFMFVHILKGHYIHMTIFLK
jgi:hypothetical protein